MKSEETKWINVKNINGEMKYRLVDKSYEDNVPNQAKDFYLKFNKKFSIIQISHVLNELHREGLLKCLNPDDHKGKLYTITPEGIDALEALKIKKMQEKWSNIMKKKGFVYKKLIHPHIQSGVEIGYSYFNIAIKKDEAYLLFFKSSKIVQKKDLEKWYKTINYLRNKYKISKAKLIIDTPLIPLVGKNIKQENIEIIVDN